MPGSRRGVTVHTPTQKINCGRGCGKQNVPLPHTCGVRDRDTKGSIIEIARFFKASDGLQFVKNKDGYSSKKPISELEIGIAVRMSCK
jgi:hypothetical protein